jgi:hypothetical protein
MDLSKMLAEFRQERDRVDESHRCVGTSSRWPG